MTVLSVVVVMDTRRPRVEQTAREGGVGLLRIRPRIIPRFGPGTPGKPRVAARKAGYTRTTRSAACALPFSLFPARPLTIFVFLLFQAHFTAPSSERRKLMSSTLSKELSAVLGIKSLPILKGDKVRVMRGGKVYKGTEGTVEAVYRKKWAVHLDSAKREKKNGQTVNIPFAASNLAIVSLGELHADRKALIEKKRASKGLTGTWEESDVVSA